LAYLGKGENILRGGGDMVLDRYIDPCRIQISIPDTDPDPEAELNADPSQSGCATIIYRDSLMKLGQGKDDSKDKPENFAQTG
jgi:hypothetical protein